MSNQLVVGTETRRRNSQGLPRYIDNNSWIIMMEEQLQSTKQTSETEEMNTEVEFSSQLRVPIK
jgi:hypothetical protein